MKWTNFLLGTAFAVAVLVVLLLIFGVKFERPLPAQGVALYNPSSETTIQGMVTEQKQFACRVSEEELGDHIVVKTVEGAVLVHLLPSRIMRAHGLAFAPGEQVRVLGSRLPYRGNDLMAREIVRGEETYFLRDQTGKSMMRQY